MNWPPVGEPVPALLVLPRAAASLDEANSAIEQWEHYSGKVLDAAQRAAVWMMMAEKRDGRWAARTTGRSEARQNGKGDEIEVVESWGLTQRAEAIVHTAHEIPTSRSAHLRLVAHLESHRDLRRLIKRLGYANSDRSIETTNGGICVYRTRTAGGGRGLDDISRLVVDEAQYAQPEQLAASTPILAANPNPQTNFVGSAGIAGKSDFWWDLRLRALRGDLSWLEHSAEVIYLDEEGELVSVSPDVYDLAARVAANPALGHRIEPEFLDEQLRLLKADLFGREHLGVWDPQPAAEGECSVISKFVWESRRDEASQILTGLAVAIAVGQDSSTASIGAAGNRADGRGHVEVIEWRDGADWVADRLAGVIERQRPLAVGVDASGPEQQIIPEIRRVCERAGLQLIELTTRAYVAACGELVDSVKGDRLAHLGQGWLDDAVRAGRRRQYGDAWMWDRRVQADITPLIAVTVARRASLEFVDEPAARVAIVLG